MATRRCFTGKVVESDTFYKLSAAAQAVYLHLNMVSDDLGFCNRVDGVVSRIRGGEAALQELESKRFILRFGEIAVIKHWKMSNTLKNDRMKPLSYPELAAQLWIKDNKSYTERPIPGGKTLYESYTGEAPRIPSGFHMESERIPNGTLTEPNRIEPNRTEPNRSGERAADSERKAWFDRILSAYPVHRQGNSDEAWAAFESFVPDGQEQAALDALDKWKKSEQWTDDDGRFVPGLSKWLVQGLWKCPPEAAKGSQWSDGTRALDQDELAAIRRMFQEDDPKGGG